MYVLYRYMFCAVIELHFLDVELFLQDCSLAADNASLEWSATAFQAARFAAPACIPSPVV